MCGILAGSLTDFGKFLTYRTMPKPHLIALLVHKCMKGMGTSDYTLMEVLSKNRMEDLLASVAVYAEMFDGEDMVKRIKSETDGMLHRNYGKWAAKLCNWNRDESFNVPGDDELTSIAEQVSRPRDALCQRCTSNVTEPVRCSPCSHRCPFVIYVCGIGPLLPPPPSCPHRRPFCSHMCVAHPCACPSQLYAAGAKKYMGCDEDVFLEILNEANDATCQAIRVKYAEVNDGRDLIADVKSKMTGNLEFAVCARLTPRYEFFAQRLKKACDGMGTDEDAICRVLGINNNEECLLIRDAFAELDGGGDLVEVLHGELSGNFQKMVDFLFSVSPPKGHWKDPVTYETDSAAAGMAFVGQLQSTFNPQNAAMQGMQPLFGQLSFLGWETANPFIIPGCDAILPPSSPPWFWPADQNYLLMSQVTDLSTGNNLLQQLQFNNAQLTQSALQNNQGATMLQAQYFNLGYGIRAASTKCVQLMQDNGNMLEFCAQRDAVMIHEACEGWGTDEDKLINILAALSKQQMKRVNEIYFQTHGKTLDTVLAGELSGFFGGSTDFQYFMNCLVKDTATLDAQFLVESMKGWGTDEKL